MIRKISVKDLLEPWKNNFTENAALPFMTTSSLLGVDVLNEFLTRCKTECKGFNALRIYFIRYDTVHDGLTNTNPHVKLMPGKDVSQVSLAFVPVKGFDPIVLGGEDCVEAGNILVLSFCDPRLTNTGDAAGTGHCPPTGCEIVAGSSN